MKRSGMIAGVMGVLMGAALSTSVQAAVSKDAIAERLKPVGDVCLQGQDCGGAAPAAAAGGKSPEDLYATVCGACHNTGAAGAPKKGGAGAWAPRISQGMDTLYNHAINGFNAMPAKGGNPSLSDDEVKSIVDYIVENSK
ncbi:c-type cytochrome [Oceanospirillum beijerinckii]|uniref:c-type cytochrome n=1 Tax=Oceanospirillum beijerinckii TaxID=64976 RepID=UPI00040D4A27|nr:c-type cytochrome [Oceanospirillum beijerinckii]